MSNVFMLPDADLLPEPLALGSAEHDALPVRCQQPGCTNPVVKPARGRTPKFCPEHKAKAKSAPGKAAWARAGEIERLLSTYVAAVGGGLQLTKLAPDGELIVMHGPAVVHELIELARTDKKLRHVLELIATPGRYGPLVMAVMPLVLGVLANHNLLPQIVVKLVTGNTESPAGGE